MIFYFSKKLKRENYVIMISREQTEKLKGLAIILVMIGHLITANKLSLPMQMNSFATFSVSIFLILSGYGLTKSYIDKGINHFFKKRFLNVYVPFVIASVITFSILGYTYSSLSELIKTVTFNQLNLKLDGTMWFIYFIFCWYFVFWLIFSLKISIHNKSIFIFIFSILLYFLIQRVPYKIISYQFTLHSFSFPIGVLIAIYYKGNNKLNTILSVLLLLSFCFSFYSLLSNYSELKLQLSSLLFGLSMFFLFSIIKFNIKYLSLVGLYSYEAYLFEGSVLWWGTFRLQPMNIIMFFSTTFMLAIVLKEITNKINKYIIRNN